MRRPLGIGAVLATIVLGAATAAMAVDAKALVLQQSDVPRGYERDDTQLLGNPGPAATASFRALAKRTGRVTGYYAHFADASKEITSVAELFRTAAGAKIYFAWYERRLRLQGERARSRLALGDGGWVYRVQSTPNSTFVLWRQGRVVASTLTHGMDNHRGLAVALARKQDRRESGDGELPPTR